MTDLQAALDKFKAEVAQLEKQKTNLNQDIIGLKSKKRFLTDAVAKLNADKATAQAKADAKIAELTNDLEAVELAIAKAKKDLEALAQQIKNANSNLENLKQKAEQEIAELDKQLQAKKNELAETDIIKEQELDKLDDIKVQITAERKKLDELAKSVEKAKTDAQNEIAQIQRTIVVEKDKLQKIEQKIEQKTKELAVAVEATLKEQEKLNKVRLQHDQFLLYRKRADKALQARESALLEGEAKLATTKRRSGVLDNL